MKKDITELFVFVDAFYKAIDVWLEGPNHYQRKNCANPREHPR